MQFFALLTRNTAKFSDADFAPLLPGEAEQRRTLYAEGAVRQVWNRGDIPGSGMMFEAADDTEVRGYLATLPLIKAGMMDVTAIVPLNPYPGFWAEALSYPNRNAVAVKVPPSRFLLDTL